VKIFVPIKFDLHQMAFFLSCAIISTQPTSYAIKYDGIFKRSSPGNLIKAWAQSYNAWPNAKAN
jgi:hypothetical protein